MSKEMKKMIVPRLRFPEFESSGEWLKQLMGELFEFQSNNSLSRDKLNYEGGLVKNIHYGDIHTKFKTLFRIKDELVPYINESESLGRAKPESYCIEGDMVFADASEDLEDIGKSIELVDLNNEKLLSGLHTILARPKDKIFATGFSGYLFKSTPIRFQIRKEAQGAKVLGISAKKMSNMELLFPEDKKEQQKNIHCITTHDDLITAQNDKIAVLRTYKKG
jgi:type I restriction enzyme S subunit